jgi:hypothetical protein
MQYNKHKKGLQNIFYNSIKTSRWRVQDRKDFLVLNTIDNLNKKLKRNFEVIT